MTCKYCLHYDRCKKLGICNIETLSICEDFADRSEWVHLPCKVGDTIYFETYRCEKSIGVQPHKVAKINVVVKIERPFGSVGAEIPDWQSEIPDWQFGKYVFLTREEAEKALKEREIND